mmetsp:Transcript_3460/g.7461  ORF Transcript_3460/g.7461 Transcript_3460/m.7461 type:complete len:82 (+) Transcript_3460:1616-1861(+)
MLPGFELLLFVFVPGCVLSRDREGHVKQKVSRREPPLLMDVTLCVGVILPVDNEDDDDEDDSSMVIERKSRSTDSLEESQC